ncbi:MAG TPA: prenyltransferase/squalene oxidase repeat-containing protein [Verrucomicrobiaceae bacterium]|jgi:squalene-hopene/tetraprenyl-beta-curcumene cyclase
MSFEARAFEETRTNARRALLDARAAHGGWEGELSSSALSTATAVFALHEFAERTDDAAIEKACRHLIREGLSWLALHQNRDGGWGDTIASISNISTTALCWAALAVDANSAAGGYAGVISAAESWLAHHAGGIDPGHLVPAIIARYGQDKTFSVPILTMCALAGRLGKGRDAWRHIPQLPFEVAAFPQRWFKRLHLPVVSYALPALISIGLVRHVRKPSLNPIARGARALARSRAMQLLTRIQPTSGGFLEATPLTSFVVMSLIGAGLNQHSVVRNGIAFLIASARPDGSWPIDTHLATWVTTLAINALAIDPQFHDAMPEPERRRARDWLLEQQYRVEHPYTLADPGAWAWTPLSGGVPDADDTPGALLALRKLGIVDARAKDAAGAGIAWLLDLQNRDGGIPTFCRGWGKLPFDRSSADLTAHVIRAIDAWCDLLDPALGARASSARGRMIDFLIRTQHADGSWMPLWFGNQHAPDDVNPTYGTARVLLAANGRDAPEWARHLASGVDWLLAVQRPGGGWGAGHDTPPSIEETSLAIEALVHILQCHAAQADSSFVELFDLNRVREAIARGMNWLMTATDRGRRFDPTPIGFYFAKLWYFEKLYPLIFCVAAMEAVNVAGLENTMKP